MNFCVNMVKCTVCMSVYDYICCHYMRGGYHVCLVKEKAYSSLCSAFEKTWVCGFKGVDVNVARTRGKFSSHGKTCGRENPDAVKLSKGQTSSS